MFSKKYVERLESIIEGLNMRIIELKNEVAETKFLKETRYKELNGKMEKIRLLLNNYDKYKYKEFIEKLSDIVVERYY